MRKMIVALLVVPVALIGCSKEAATAGGGSTNKPSAAAKPAPAALKDLKIEDLAPGTGKGAKDGDTLVMKYTGKLGNGSVFDTNDKPDGSPFTFVLGAGNVIKGWDKGLVGVKRGGKRKLSIPYTLAYGEQGSGTQIPPKSDLFFDVEVLDILSKEDADTVTIMKDDEAGSGPEVKAGSTVTFRYNGTFSGGKEFDSNMKGEALTVKIGSGKLIPGLEAGMKGMKAGGKRSLRIPPAVGYGPGGRGMVPPNSILYFDVVVEAVK